MENIQLEFEHSKTKNQVEEDTLRFLVTHGYKIKELSEQEIEGKKGGLLQNAFSLNPLSWKNKFIVKFNNNLVSINLEIDHTFQIVSKKELKTWEEFVNSFKETIETGMESNEKVKSLIKKSRDESIKIILIGLLGGIGLGVPMFLLVAYFQLGEIGDSIASMWSVIGATSIAFWYHKKINAT